MRRLLTTLLTVGIGFMSIHGVYFIEYEKYTWNQSDSTMYLTINCPPGGCVVDGKRFVCSELNCVKSILNAHGTEHLLGVWMVEWFGQQSPRATVRKLEVVPAFELKESHGELLNENSSVTVGPENMLQVAPDVTIKLEKKP